MLPCQIVRYNSHKLKIQPVPRHSSVLLCSHYVPAVSYAINIYNKATKSQAINLKGLAIGNGLTDPAIQYGAYADFAMLNKLIPKTVGRAMKLVGTLNYYGECYLPLKENSLQASAEGNVYMFIYSMREIWRLHTQRPQCISCDQDSQDFVHL